MKFQQNLMTFSIKKQWEDQLVQSL